MASWRILVSLHNLVNIPPAACERPDRRFTVVARQIYTGATSGRLEQSSNPTVTFAASEVTESAPGAFEIRLDTARTAGGVCAWRSLDDVIDVVVEVSESQRVVGSSTTFQVPVRRLVEDTKLITRIIGTEMGQVGLSLSVDPTDRAGYKARLEKFLRRHNPSGLRLVHNVVDVVPEVDTFTKLYRKYGLRHYETRLRAFFAVYGPEYAADIPALLAQWENREEELMRNLALDNGPEPADVDKDQRLTAYLTQYGLDRDDDAAAAVAALIAEHKGNSNGNGNGNDDNGGDSAGLFAALVARYGPEPDPRMYLFVAPHYPPGTDLDTVRASSSSGIISTTARQEHVSSSYNYAPQQSRRLPLPLSRAASPPSPPRRVSPSRTTPLRPWIPSSRHIEHPYPSSSSPPDSPQRRAPTPYRSPSQRDRAGGGDGSGDSGANQSYLGLYGHSSSPSPAAMAGGRAGGGDDRGYYGNAVFDGGADGDDTDRRRSRPHPEPSVARTDAPADANDDNATGHRWAHSSHRDRSPPNGSSSSSLWLHLITMLRTTGPRAALEPGYFYYCSARTFTDLVDDLDAFSKRERDTLLEEWRRLCRTAVVEAPLDSSSAAYDGAVADAALVAGLQPVQLRVTALTSFTHREQHKVFSAALGAAQERRTERLVLVGDFKTLLEMARHGVAAGEGREEEGGSGDNGGGDAARGRGAPGLAPAAVFARRPFLPARHPHATCLLVCDVVVGRCHATAPPARLPHSGTAAFLERYDSSAFADAVAGPSLAVYSRRQVLPRLLVQCTVDPGLAPCPAHPDRGVEYYVPAENAVACSRCVVMGPYKGLAVLPVEEAATLARGQLAEMQRAADGVVDGAAAYESRLLHEEAAMPTALRRTRAIAEIARLRREVEERVAAIVAAVDGEDAAQLGRLRADRSESEGVRAAAAALSAELGASLRSVAGAGAGAAMAAVQALQRAKQERALEAIARRARERIPAAALNKEGEGEQAYPLDDGDARRLKMNPARADGDDDGGGAQGDVPSRRRGPAPAAAVPAAYPDRSHLNETPQRPSPADRSHAARSPHNTSSGHLRLSSSSAAHDLYSRYRSLTPAIEARETLRTRRPPPPHQTSAMTHEAPSIFLSTTTTSLARLRDGGHQTAAETSGDGVGVGVDVPSHAMPSPAPSTPAVPTPKEALTRGWALLHDGDEAGAAAAWCAVRDSHSDREAPGAKARAYLAEAIGRDYEAAAGWYRRCLEIDPSDRLTAYNYGVLLEALLRRPGEAVAMYDRAAALGDHVAAARAQQLRGDAAAASATGGGGRGGRGGGGGRAAGRRSYSR